MIVCARSPAATPPRAISTSTPSACHSRWHDRRLDAQLLLASRFGGGRCSNELIAILSEFEPNVPWTSSFLTTRAHCYADRAHPLADATRDLATFRAAEPAPLAVGR